MEKQYCKKYTCEDPIKAPPKKINKKYEIKSRCEGENKYKQNTSLLMMMKWVERKRERLQIIR